MGGPLPVVDRDKMPILFHEPNVYTGFRPLYQPWKNYVLSLFQWHNEVMNVWTHLLALVVVLLRAALWSREFDLILDPYMWPLAVGISTMVVLYTCSTCAHCFSNRSELTHYTCFMCDYAGIGLYGFGSTILHYWYCLHEDFHGTLSHELATPVGALLGVLTCICCSISKTKYKRPYPFIRRVWQMSSVLAVYLWLIFPIWYKIWLYVHDGIWEESFRHHLQQMSWFTLGGFFFGSDIPQRFFPGKFDLVGHSHQLFHICIFMTTYEQMNAVYLEMTDDIHNVHDMQAPTWLNTWGAFWFVVLSNCVVIYIFHYSVRARLEVELLKKCDDHKGCSGESTKPVENAVAEESNQEQKGFSNASVDAVKNGTSTCVVANGDKTFHANRSNKVTCINGLENASSRPITHRKGFAVDDIESKKSNNIDNP